MSVFDSIIVGSLVLTGTDANGVQWGVDVFEGWGSPAGTLSPVQKPRQDGAWGGLSYLTARVLHIGGQVVAPTMALAEQAIDTLIAAVPLGNTTLTVIEAGLPRTLTVRRDGEVLATLTPGADLIWSYSIQLVATDPRKLGADLTGTTALPSTSGGLSWPLSWPLSWTATTVTGQINLANPGNATGPVKLVINGPITAPTITHVSTGLALAFAASFSLGAGEFVTVDMERQEVLAQGQAAASRNAWVTSAEFTGFDPGPNTWALTAPSYSAGTVQVIATPAWS